MALHHPQARSPSAFAFPASSPSSARGRDPAHIKCAPPLGAAFEYPTRGDSLAHGATHAPQASTSSSSSSFDSRSRNSTARSAVSSTYTSFTSDSYDQDDACDDGYSDSGSVLDSLYRDFSSSRLDDSPPRFHKHTPSTDSTMQLRERTRYRSSASLMAGPGARPGGGAPHLDGAFGHLSLAPSAAPDSHMALLAALAAASSTLDRCFCGGEPEEDSIYCSRPCAQADALNALCGTSSSAEEVASSSDAASMRSGSSVGSGSGGIDSHYRRVEREEMRRAKERERAQRKQEKERKARAAEERTLAERGRTPGSLYRSEGDVGAARIASQESVAPPPRTSSRRTPSLSSSISSLASSAAPSPISPAFPHHAGFPPHQATSPFIVEPPTPSCHSFHDAPLGAVAEEEPLARPCTPNPKGQPPHFHSPASPAHLDAGDIYGSYLLATPQAGDKLRTPTQHPHSESRSGSTSNSTPRAAFPGEHGDDDDSPTQRGSGAAGVAGVGLRMLELCDSDDEFDDGEADQVAPLRAGHRRGAPLGGGHTKGKLSFDDVVGILSG
ncbi:Proteophosphoglycan ppg4 [Rhodotorula diobovata]|uniref:Proteophosphoglycan ppg4 n=1 Tax=Rhodotorula diobovata TaxID=5288 RepID=A0A5C5FKL6_9BASI|nr:Proteophosphoglycan ppg4 [Rhodotorula diobovata]